METVMDPTVPRGWPGAMIVNWNGSNTDIDDNKRTEKNLRQSEEDLRTIIDTIRQYIVVLAPDGKVLYTNRVALDLTGLTIGEVNDGGYFPRVFHPDDLDCVRAERQENLLRGTSFDLQMRLLLKNGEYRWQLLQYDPLKDDRGRIIRWYVTATDIDDQKRTEESLRNDNFRLDQERVFLEEEIRSELGFEQIIGRSSALKRVLELIETVAPSDSTVLLLGETGTGKELIARALHERSRRKSKTFVKLNCAAIPTGLLESELFGHEKGAFTGAIIQKVGRMELADQGTLFLDEVGDIPIEIQPKLLRALQEKEFERLGSTHTRKVNVRLVAATNCNLEKMIADRQFRSDLFYRLNVFPIRIPPLRERKEDIPLLVAYFVQKFARQMQKRIDSIPVATMKALAAWEWPGNIRELENFIERAVILTRGESLAAPLAELRKVTTDEPVRESALKGEHDIARIVKETIASLKDKSPENEHSKRQHEEIVRVLAECKGRVGGPDGAAARMGLSRTTLISRMKKLEINAYEYA
jgi:PAS domain S-box-containing protein